MVLWGILVLKGIKAQIQVLKDHKVHKETWEVKGLKELRVLLKEHLGQREVREDRELKGLKERLRVLQVLKVLKVLKVFREGVLVLKEDKELKVMWVT